MPAITHTAPGRRALWDGLVAATLPYLIADTIWRATGSKEAAIRADPLMTGVPAITAIVGPAARICRILCD